jgi:predicted dehydrogenase
MVRRSDISTAVIGSGFIGTVHIEALRRIGVKVAGLLDSSPELGARRAEDLGLPKAYGSLGDVLSDDSIQVVHVTSPNELHYEQASAILTAGKHVICEKPLVDSVAACDRIAVAVERAATTSGARFMPIFQYRFGDGAAKARALIDTGITGRLFTASASTWWRRGKGYYAEAPWRGTWAGERGGCVLSHAIHNHDMLTWMAGPIVELRAMAATRVNDVQTEDCAVAIGRTADGALVTMNVTLGAAGESSQLVWHFDNVTITSSSEAYDPGAGPWNFEFRRSAFAEEAEQVWTDLAPSGSQYTGQFQGFVHALAGGSEFPVTLADAQASLELVTAWYHSERTGSVETLPLAADHPARNSWQPGA